MRRARGYPTGATVEGQAGAFDALVSVREQSRADCEPLSLVRYGGGPAGGEDRHRGLRPRSWCTSLRW